MCNLQPACSPINFDSSEGSDGNEEVLINLSLEMFGILSVLRFGTNKEIEIAPNQISDFLEICDGCDVYRLVRGFSQDATISSVDWHLWASGEVAGSQLKILSQQSLGFRGKLISARELHACTVQLNEQTFELLNELDARLESHSLVNLQPSEPSDVSCERDTASCAMGFDCVAMLTATDTEACPNQQICNMGAGSVSSAYLRFDEAHNPSEFPSTLAEYRSVGNSFHKCIALFFLLLLNSAMLGYAVLLVVQSSTAPRDDFEMRSDIEVLEFDRMRSFRTS